MFRVQYNKNVVVEMYNTVSVVKLVMNIYCEYGKLHSLLYIEVVMPIITFCFGSRLPSMFGRLCDLGGA